MVVRSAVLSLVLAGLPVVAVSEPAVVANVEAGDMLKLRAGPGTGYKVIVGLPNGTAVIKRDCERVGGTPWCQVALKAAPRLKGYVSGHYLSE